MSKGLSERIASFPLSSLPALALSASAEMKTYQSIPVIANFTNENGFDNLKETIETNYRKVKQEILSLVDSEIERIKNNPVLNNLIKG